MSASDSDPKITTWKTFKKVIPHPILTVVIVSLSIFISLFSFPKITVGCQNLAKQYKVHIRINGFLTC